MRTDAKILSVFHKRLLFFRKNRSIIIGRRKSNLIWFENDNSAPDFVKLLENTNVLPAEFYLPETKFFVLKLFDLKRRVILYSFYAEDEVRRSPFEDDKLEIYKLIKFKAYEAQLSSA